MNYNSLKLEELIEFKKAGSDLYVLKCCIEMIQIVIMKIKKNKIRIKTKFCKKWLTTLSEA